MNTIIEIGDNVRIERGPVVKTAVATPELFASGTLAAHYAIGKRDKMGEVIVAGQPFTYLDWNGPHAFHVYEFCTEDWVGETLVCDEQGQPVLVAVVADEQAVADVHHEDGHRHRDSQRRGRRPYQQAEQQRNAAEELGAAGQQRHRDAGREADRAHPLAGAFEAVATEGAEQFLRAVRDEDDADGHAQRQWPEAGIGGEKALDEVAHVNLLQSVGRVQALRSQVGAMPVPSPAP